MGLAQGNPTLGSDMCATQLRIMSEVLEPEDLAGSQSSCPSPREDLLSKCSNLVPVDHHTLNLLSDRE